MLIRTRQPRLILPDRQQAIVEHFARFTSDEERARYTREIEFALRAKPHFRDMHVTAACIKAVKATRR
jgi:hypothetical protein